MANFLNRLKDAWFTIIDSWTYGNLTSYDREKRVSERNSVFMDRLERQKHRRNALGTWLKVILSDPREQPTIETMFHLAATTMPGVSDDQLPVLLWYRDIVSSQKPYSDLRRYVLEAMIDLLQRDIWPQEINTTDPNELVRQWRALLAAQKTQS